MIKKNWLRPLTYALIVFIGPLLAYYLIYVQAREEALLDRIYSHLTNITTRTETRFNSVFEVVRNACKNTLNFKDVLEENDLGLGIRSFRNNDGWSVCNAIVDNESEQGRNIVPANREQLTILYGDINVYANTNVLVGDIDVSDRFHDVFIFDSKGNVIYQKYPEKGRIDKLQELTDNSPADDGKKSLISDPLKSLRINYRGRWYLMPSQPLQIDFGATNRTRWQMVGLIEDSQFSADKMRFQPDTVAWVVLFISVIVLIGPFLKIWYLGRFESFKKFDVVLLIGSGFTLCCLLTLVVIQLNSRNGLNEFMGLRLETISDNLAQGIDEELTKSIDELQLAEAKMHDVFAAINPENYRGNSNCTHLATSEGTGAVSKTSKGGILKNQTVDYLPEFYPYFNMVYLMDRDGCQIVKWSTRSQPTNALKLEDRTYFKRPLPNAKLPLNIYSIDGREFFIQFITSRSTGEKSVALSMPVSKLEVGKGRSTLRQDCLASSSDQPKPCVVVMTMESFRIFQSVLPYGFGFAVVDKEGNILTHHEGDTNTEINLVDELSDGSLLQRALYSRSHDKFLSDYHGDLHEFLVKPLNIQNADLFLVSFYSHNTVLMPLLEAVGATLVAWLIWFTLLFSLALTLWQWNKFLEGQLFAKTSALLYRFETLLLFSTAIVFILSVRYPEISIVAPIYIVPVLMLWLFKVSKNFRNRPFTVVAISWVLMLSATSLPAYGLFRLIQAETFSGYFQLQILDFQKDTLAQKQTINNWLSKVETPTNGNEGFEEFERFHLGDYSPLNRYARVWKQFPLFDAPIIEQAVPTDDFTLRNYPYLKDIPKRNNLWQFMLSKLPDYSDNTVQLHSLYRNPKLVVMNGEPYPAKAIAANIFRQNIYGHSTGLPESLGLVLLIILGVALWYVLVRTLGLRTENYLRLFNFKLPGRNQGGRDLIYGMGEFTKKEYFAFSNDNDNKRLLWIDLRVDSAAEIEEKLKSLLALNPYDEPGGEDIVIIDHFDDGLIDKEILCARIELLEKLVRKQKLSLIVLLAIDPLSFVTATYDADNNAPIIARLASVLALFDVTFYQENPPERYGNSKEDKTLREECYHPNLRGIYQSIRSQSSQKHLDSNEIIQLVKSRANAIYQHMWNLCSRAEKIMLVELAHENLVNPNNWDLARRLKQRGYLRRDPFHRIFNESFKQFILRMERVENIESWRQDSASTWHNIRAPLFVVVIGAIIFLAFTQPSFFNSVFAFAAAGTASLPFLVNLIMAKLKSGMEK